MHIHIIPVNSHLLSLIIIARLGTGGPFTVDSKLDWVQLKRSHTHLDTRGWCRTIDLKDRVILSLCVICSTCYVWICHGTPLDIPHYSFCRQLDVVVKFTMVPKLLREFVLILRWGRERSFGVPKTQDRSPSATRQRIEHLPLIQVVHRSYSTDSSLKDILRNCHIMR